MNNPLFVVLLLTAGVLHGQDFSQQAKTLQAKYPEEAAAVLRANVAYVLTKDSRVGAKVKVTRSEKLLSLRYNQAIHESEVYDGNSQVETFTAESSLKQRLTDANKVCGTYTSEGLFFDDSKFCMQELKLKEVGEVWDLTSVKKLTTPNT